MTQQHRCQHVDHMAWIDLATMRALEDSRLVQCKRKRISKLLARISGADRLYCNRHIYGPDGNIARFSP